ncbi:MAG: hypothetical protein BGO69_03690 [Bacteroidetes bacterium 46-16]|nr:MAG: hypothetical protein BGO69_03690 [Bacteroidetes bacterium 46-16]
MTKSVPSKSLVLYADDDPDDLHLVEHAFSDYAQTVELKTFMDGEALLRYINEYKDAEPFPCLIIIDINMPRINGKEVLKKLRETAGYEDAPVVLFSTSTLPADMAFAKSYGAGFMTKPLHYSQIYQLVDKMIDHCADDVKKYIRSTRK